MTRRAVKHARQERIAPPPLPSGYPIATAAVEAPEPIVIEEPYTDHAALVAALPEPEPDEPEPAPLPPPTLAELMAADIREATRKGRFDIAATIDVVAIRWGSIVIALAEAEAVASPELAAAFASLRALL